MTPFDAAALITALILTLIIIFLGYLIFRLLNKIDDLKDENEDLISHNVTLQKKLNNLDIEV